MAQIAIHHNPFYLHENVERFDPVIGQSIRSFLDDQKITEFNKPTICLVNGDPVLRASWSDTLIEKDTIVSFITLPQGGGGGGKIFKSVLSIALAVAAPYASAAIASTFGITSTIGTALITAGVTFAGNALINALIPAPTPSSAVNSFNASNPSPTYSLQAQGNKARLGEPIPVIYGRHIIYPDFASTPYPEFENNEQYLYQLHVIGQGHYDLEQIRIEDTPISSFDEITYEVIEPNGTITLFNTEVTTAPEVAGQELFENEWVGPFIANPAETTTNDLAIDIVLPRGLYYAADNGSLSNRTVTWDVQARLIDDEGVALGSWLALGSETITEATNTPIRRTYHYAVTSGRYEVRLSRTNAKDTSARVGNDITWQALKAHLDHVPDYGAITLLALKMKATNNLSQSSSRLVNAIVTRKLKIWDEINGWSNDYHATSSIAWACLDILKAKYGSELDDHRIDLQAFYALDQIWSARGDTFSGVFDSKITVWDAITQVVRCGRAVTFLQGGIVRCVRDEIKTLPVALFSPRNIVKDTLSIDYVMPGEDTADSITVQYFNSKTWKPDEITVSLPDSSADKPATVGLFGSTDKDHATREGLYMAAANRYRRRLVSFQTELEGLIPTYGDLIALNHDMPQWGQSGEIVAYNHPTLSLSEAVEFEIGATHYIGLRKADGSVSGPWEVSAGSNDRSLVLSEALDFDPYVGNTQERTHFAFGVGEEWSVLARVMSIRPRGNEIEINAVIENNLVHSADNPNP